MSTHTAATETTEAHQLRAGDTIPGYGEVITVQPGEHRGTTAVEYLPATGGTITRTTSYANHESVTIKKRPDSHIERVRAASARHTRQGTNKPAKTEAFADGYQAALADVLAAMIAATDTADRGALDWIGCNAADREVHEAASFLRFGS